MTGPISVLIVEDEFLTAESIKDGLEEMGYIVSGMARSAAEACEIMDEGSVDIVILDISIHGKKDGIWIAEKINEDYQLPFIFLTAFSDKQTVQSAIATKPYGYLVKPFNKVDIYTSIEVALKNFAQSNVGINIPSDGLDQPLEMGESLFVKQKHLYIKIKVADILFIQSELKYVQIHVASKKYLLRYNISDLLKILPVDHFFQTHRSFIVNKDAVDNIGANFLMVNGYEIPISTGRRDEIVKMFRFL